MAWDMKKFFSVTKYLWIGGAMGLIQQFIGLISTVKYQGRVLFDLADIMNFLAVYAAVILLVIIREVSPKQQFRDILLYFVGLDFFYYLYETGHSYYLYLSLPEELKSGQSILSASGYNLDDFVYWTCIGLAAAVWALVATKLRDMGKKKLYIVMLIPLFAVMAIQLVAFTCSGILFFIPLEDSSISNYESYIIGALTALVTLVLCIYKFRKKQDAKKINAQEG